MKKYPEYFYNLSKVLFLFFTLSFFGTHQALAQGSDLMKYLKRKGVDTSSHSFNLPINLSQFNAHSIGETYYEVTIPNNLPNNYQYLYFKAVGGDGSEIKSQKDHPGAGATVSGYMEINDQFPKGTTLRFIIGNAGYSQDNSTAGGCGGGGTGIVFKKPNASNWEILMVAGGGGGASRESGYGGRGGQTVTDGAKGRGYSKNNGGTDGGNGKKWDDSGYPGQGYKSAMSNGVPVGANGGGSYGFGGGGGPKALETHDGYDLDPFASLTGDDYPGAGGGGYSGGGGGKENSDGRGGGGGGSYLHPNIYLPNMEEGGAASSPSDGYIQFQLYKSLPEFQLRMASDVNYAIGREVGLTYLQLVDDQSITWDKARWVTQVEDATIRVADLSNKCFGAVYGRYDVGTKLFAEKCNGSNDQKWIYDGRTQLLRFVRDPAKCANRVWTKDHKSAAMEMGLCGASDIPKWSLDGIPAPNMKSNTGLISWDLHPDKCINVATIGSKLELDKCTDNLTDKTWYFDGVQIRLYDNLSKCMHLDRDGAKTYAKIYLYNCNNTDAQKWFYDGTIKSFRSKLDVTKCMDVQGGVNQIGTDIQLYPCNGTASQVFSLEEAPHNAYGPTLGAIRHVGDTRRCIDLKSNKAANTSNIQSWPCHGDAPQRWFVEGKQIKLLENPAYCLDLNHANTSDNTNIQLYQCNGTDAQDWIFDVPYQFIRSNIDPNKCIYVNDSYDMRLTTCDYHNPSRMQWALPGNYSQRLDGDNLRIHLAKNENKCVDMAKNAEDGNLRVYTCEENNSQYFVFDGATIKRANNPGLCVDIESGNMDNGTNIRLWHCNGTDAQKWIYDGVSGRIHSQKDPNKCMRFTNGYTTNGTNVKISDCNNDKAQVFIIK